MAEFRIDVVVNTGKAREGIRQLKGELNGLERSVNVTQTAFRGFLGLLGIEAIRRAAVGVIRLSDTFTEIENKLRVVTDTQEELVAVTERLLEVSNETRSSFEATSQLYSRVALATRELGITANETLRFTESLNKAIIISGATAQEASAGLIQFSQGLASGALRGDELRSVLEQLPVVADVIADQLGVTRGELRDLGAQGKITADVILDAFRNAGDELDQEFGSTVRTVSQALQQLENNAIALAGAFDDLLGVTDGVVSLIDRLSVAIETLTEVAKLADAAIALFSYEADDAAENTEDWEFSLTNLLTALNPTLFVLDKLTDGSIRDGLKDIREETEELAGISPTEGILDQVKEIEASIETVSTAVQEYIDQIERSTEALIEDSRERKIQIDLLKIESKLKQELNGVEQEALETALRRQQQLRDQNQVLDGINRRTDDYRRTLEATQELLAAGAITGREASAALRATELGGDVEGLIRELEIAEQLRTDQFAEQETELNERLIDRQRLLVEAARAEVITETEKFDLLRQLNAEYNQDLAELEETRKQVQISGAKTIADSLTSIARDTLGEQSKTFQALFALSKGFAIAQSTINIAQAISEALKLGFPAGLVAAGTVAAEAANIVSTIQSTNFQGGFATGGQFTVGGSGGTDSQLVSMAVTPGERVTVETPQQQRASDTNRENGAGGQTPSLNVVNVLDPDLLENFLTSPAGEETLVNVIERNANSINSVLNA